MFSKFSKNVISRANTYIVRSLSTTNGTLSSCGTSSCGVIEDNVPTKKQFMDYTLDELEKELVSMGIEKYRGKQLFKWIYSRGAVSFDEITELNKGLRERLSNSFDIYSTKIVHTAKSTDGTRKHLVRVLSKENKGDIIESVFIPGVGTPHLHDAALPSEHQHKYPIRKSSGYGSLHREDADELIDVMSNFNNYDRGCLCISSQVGCSLKCTMCSTGTIAKKYIRHLSPGEIVGQIMLAKHDIGDFTFIPYDPHDIDPATGLPKGQVGGNVVQTVGTGLKMYKPLPKLTSIVFMGSGEPLLAYRSVLKALKIMMDVNGLGLSKRRITVSTSGVVPNIKRLGEDACVNLAISLHAPRDDLRDNIVPLNKQFSLTHLMDSIKEYPGVKNSRIVTFEYVMLRDINDTAREADELVQLIRGVPSLVNLIPFNEWKGSRLRTSTHEAVNAFKEAIQNHPLNRGQIKVSVRTPRGRDISAACGQLALDIDVLKAANKLQVLKDEHGNPEKELEQYDRELHTEQEEDLFKLVGLNSELQHESQ